VVDTLGQVEVCTQAKEGAHIQDPAEGCIQDRAVDYTRDQTVVCTRGLEAVFIPVQVEDFTRDQVVDCTQALAGDFTAVLVVECLQGGAVNPIEATSLLGPYSSSSLNNME
jgi:hypothetical protein